MQHAHHMHPLTPLITYSNDHFSPGSPPGHLSPEIDPKTGEHRDGGDTASAKLGHVQLSKGTVTVSVPRWEWGALRWTVPLLAKWFSQPGPCVVGRGCSRWPGVGPHLVTALVGVRGDPSRSPLWLSQHPLPVLQMGRWVLGERWGAQREMRCLAADGILGERWGAGKEMGCWEGDNARREMECSEGGGMLEGRLCIQRQTGCSEEDGARKEGGTWGKMGVLGGRQGAWWSTDRSEAAMSTF